MTEGQYGIRSWSHVWAFTHHRFSVNPQPELMASIVRMRALQQRSGVASTIGFSGYSEGVNDDLNKAIWSLLSLEPHQSLREVVSQYAAFHFGQEVLLAGAVDGLFGLEANWVGDPLSAAALSRVASTLDTWRSIERLVDTAAFARSWRLQMYTMRAYHDAYQQARYACEAEIERAALRAAAGVGCGVGASPSERIAATLKIISAISSGTCSGAANATVASWRDRVLQLVRQLDATVGGQVILTQDSTLNTEWLDCPLSSVPWINSTLQNVSRADPRVQSAALHRILDWEEAGPNGFYDALGDVSRSSHLVVPADEGRSDPARYHTPSIGGYTHDVLRRISSQRTAFILYDANLTLSYTGLDKASTYQLRVQFHRPMGHAFSPPTSDPNNYIRLVANGQTILQPYTPMPTQLMSYDLPKEATGSGALTVSCNMPPGVGNSGRGCGIAEVWLSTRG